MWHHKYSTYLRYGIVQFLKLSLYKETPLAFYNREGFTRAIAVQNFVPVRGKCPELTLESLQFLYLIFYKWHFLLM